MKPKFKEVGKKVDANFQIRLEKFLRKNLPVQFRDFLIEFNGGIPSPDSFNLQKYDLSKKNTNIIVYVEKFFSAGELTKIWGYTKDIIDELSVLPIADISGSAILCIGIGQENVGEIYYWDADFGLTYLTDSLTEFWEILE